MNRLRYGAVALVLPMLLAVPGPASAKSRGSFMHRHPTLTTAAAGYGAYRLAKHGAKGRARAGRRGNFAERHPVMTGLAGAAVAHHYAKKRR